MKKQSLWFIGITCSVFLAIPFLYAYLRLPTDQTLLRNTSFSYVVITLVGLAFALFLSRQIKTKREDELKDRFLLIFGAFVSLYSIFIFVLTMSNYERMVSQAIDVFYFHDVVWQLSEFKIPYLYHFSQPVFAEWSQHFSPIFYLFVPIYWILPSADMLMIVQALVFLTGTIPLYLIAKKHLHSRLIGLSLAFAFIAFGGMQFGIAYGFHEIMLFPTIFFWMYYFYLERKIKRYLLFVLLALCVKEEVAFIMIFWGIYLLIFRRDKILGSSTATLGLAWYVFCFMIIFPAFTPHGGGFGYWGQYSQSNGSGILGIILYIVTHPLNFLTTLVTPDYKIDTFFQSFGAFGFLLFLYPPSLLIILPSLMEKLLSNGIAGMIGTHYSAALTGVTVIATIEAIDTIRKNKKLVSMVGNTTVFTGTMIFYLALFFNVLYGYYVFTLNPNTYRTGYPEGAIMVDPSENTLMVLSQVINSIPPHATISAQGQIVSHINRYYKLVSDAPNKNETADYVIFDTQLPPPVLDDTRTVNNYLADLVISKHYQLIVNNSGVLLYKRIVK
ncbi:MAG TPA: DUF2079 domain-containing protein [Candidatus Acidoferrales bacterium]|nr:DUF2079 domain-containing protein [Candidatus Acidoferrales bacterium]